MDATLPALIALPVPLAFLFIPDASATLVQSVGKFVEPTLVDKNSNSTDIPGIVLLYRFTKKLTYKYNYNKDKLKTIG